MSTNTKYEEDIKRWIKEDLTVKRMLEKAREDEDKPYQGGKTVFYDRVLKTIKLRLQFS